MPSISPINKQKLVNSIFEVAVKNEKLLQDDYEPVTWIETLLGITLITGLNKRLVQGICNDMIQAGYIENIELQECIVITLKGKEIYKEIEEIVATHEHKKLLRQNSRK